MAGIDSTLLHQLFIYRNGLLIRKITTSPQAKEGKIISCCDKEGYLRVSIHNKNYRVHRLIFMMFYGFMPKYIDHINNNRSDNRIENLREATLNENQHNRKKSIHNTTGFKNVYFAKNTNNWYVQLRINNKKISFYGLESVELADLVAQEARSKYHKAFARNN
jgi:hypothetical protein